MGIVPILIIHFQHSLLPPKLQTLGLEMKKEKRMAAFLIVDIAQIRDESTYKHYRQQVSPGLSAAGGQYLARGGAIEVLEGGWEPTRIVLVRFDSSAAARCWWASNDYASLKQMRQASTTTNMILVEGVADGASL
jgi:uncharacterized protein (DUF1330 family)